MRVRSKKAPLRCRTESSTWEAQVVLGILTLLALLVFVVVSIAYNQQRSKWTFTFQGEWVLIGDRYTDAARVDSRTPGINKDILFKDFGEKSTDVWTENGLQREVLQRFDSSEESRFCSKTALPKCLTINDWLFCKIAKARGFSAKSKVAILPIGPGLFTDTDMIITNSDSISPWKRGSCDLRTNFGGYAQTRVSSPMQSVTHSERTWMKRGSRPQ
jgi:hypothetical protein